MCGWQVKPCEAQGTGSTIDYFLINAMNVISSYEVIHRGSNLSYHLPMYIMFRCLSIIQSNDITDTASSKATVKQLH